LQRDGSCANKQTAHPSSTKKKEQMTDDFVTTDDSETSAVMTLADDVPAPDYLLDEIDAELDEELDLDLAAEAPITTDSLQLFLNEAGRYPLLTAAEEVQPQARRLDRPALPDAGDHARRPHPGGRDRTDPRDGEVRLAQGIQVLDVCDLVDPPGRSARRR
jgi:hypothetical protein